MKGPGTYYKSAAYQLENTRRLAELAAQELAQKRRPKYTSPSAFMKPGDPGRRLQGEELERRKRELMERK